MITPTTIGKSIAAGIAATAILTSLSIIPALADNADDMARATPGGNQGFTWANNEVTASGAESPIYCLFASKWVSSDAGAPMYVPASQPKTVKLDEEPIPQNAPVLQVTDYGRTAR